MPTVTPSILLAIQFEDKLVPSDLFDSIQTADILNRTLSECYFWPQTATAFPVYEEALGNIIENEHSTQHIFGDFLRYLGEETTMNNLENDSNYTAINILISVYDNFFLDILPKPFRDKMLSKLKPFDSALREDPTLFVKLDDGFKEAGNGLLTSLQQFSADTTPSSAQFKLLNNPCRHVGQEILKHLWAIPRRTGHG